MKARMPFECQLRKMVLGETPALEKISPAENRLTYLRLFLYCCQ